MGENWREKNIDNREIIKEKYSRKIDAIVIDMDMDRQIDEIIYLKYYSFMLISLICYNILGILNKSSSDEKKTNGGHVMAEEDLVNIGGDLGTQIYSQIHQQIDLFTDRYKTTTIRQL